MSARSRVQRRLAILLLTFLGLHWYWFRAQIFYFEKIRVFQAGIAPEYISME